MRPRVVPAVPETPTRVAAAAATAAPVPARRRRPTVPERLQAAWKVGPMARAGDADLREGAPLLWREHLARGFFGPAFDGMQRLTAGRIEVQLAPSRASQPRAKDETSSCVFCTPRRDERMIAWRGYALRPNLYPYGDAGSEHLLLTTARHAPQQFSPSILGDMIDYQRAVGGEPVLHFNGTVSNSQPHFHWHATRARLPLEQAWSAAPRSVYLRTRGGVLFGFDDGLYAGVGIQGGRDFVVRWAQEVVRRLDGAAIPYNLLLLPRQDSSVRLVVVPRRPGSSPVEVPGWGTIGMSAFGVAGRMVTRRAALPPEAAAQLPAVVRGAIIPPGAIGALESLGRGAGRLRRDRG